MPSLKEVRNRINSVNSTKQITNAMKMVSASKLRRNQEAVLKLRPYIKKFTEIIDSISSMSEQNNEISPFLGQRLINNVLIISVSSNRGMCGSFNSNVIKQTVNLINEDYAELNQAGKVSIISIGKKTSDYFNRNKYNIINKYDSIYDKLNYENILPIIDSITKMYINKEFDICVVVSNRFKNAAVYDLTVEQLLPIKLNSSQENKTKKQDYIFEPNKEQILSSLIAQYIKIQFYRTLLSSFAAEHGSRMAAMSKATDNAMELLKGLRLSYNKARQTSITNEILEIVGGAEALRK